MFLDIDKKLASSIAVVDSDKNQITYSNLVELSKVAFKQIKKRSIVFHLCENNVGGVAWYVAMLNSEIVPLLLSANIDRNLLNTLFEEYKPQYICMPSKVENKYNYQKISENFNYSVYRTNNDFYPIYNDLSLLLPTSGSTGSPKLVRHCYENIEASALNISTFFELNGYERPLLDLPMFYTYGLSIINSHLLAGATILITNLGITQKEYWEFVKEQRATTFTGVPFSFEILKRIRFTRMNLPDLKVLSQGGSKLSFELNMEFAEFAKDNGKKYIATYGQTEGTARMAFLPPEFAISKCGSIGKAVPNGKLYLKDVDGNVITKPRTQGEMYYEGRNVTLGYAQRKEDLELGDERKGVLNTGDIAEFDEDGFFYIIGRKSRFLKLYGYRVGLDECEQLIRSQFSIECACVGSDDLMTIFTTDSRFVKEIPDFLSKKTGIIHKAFNVIVISDIPKNEAGKILYSKLKDFNYE